MEYVYAALLLNCAKQPITEENVKKVLHAAGVKADDGRVKALVGALEGVNIEEAIKEAAVPMMAAPAAAPSGHAQAGKKEEKKEEKKSEEQAAVGLAGLFG